MNNIYIVTTEPLPTRYTGQWFDNIPKQLKEHLTSEALTRKSEDIRLINVENIPALERDATTTHKTSPGAFLNFATTAEYKADQIGVISRLFQEGLVEPDDVFLVTDAWNPMAHMIRYMSALLDIPVKIAGIWHAGTYDRADIISREFHRKGRESWGFHEESALFELYDLNFFATKFHYELFMEQLCDTRGWHKLTMPSDRCAITGFPMEYMTDIDQFFLLSNTFQADNVAWSQKQDIVVFPHRISDEKNPEVFRKVRERLVNSGITCVLAQEEGLSKEEYHHLLLKSKMVFSANEQETLGIGTFEGMAAGAFPMIPKDLSYREMYPEHEYARLPRYFYDSKYRYDDKFLAEEIVHRMDILDKELFGRNTPTVSHTRGVFQKHTNEVYQTYFQGGVMYDLLCGDLVEKHMDRR